MIAARQAAGLEGGKRVGNPKSRVDQGLKSLPELLIQTISSIANRKSLKQPRMPVGDELREESLLQKTRLWEVAWFEKELS